MVRPLNVPHTTAKLPVLRYAKADAAVERADVTGRQSRQRRRVQVTVPEQPIGMPHQIHTYAKLRQQIHGDLRIQHPEWVESNGESSMDLMELLDTLTGRGSNE
jgi:hypothetical protein